MAAVTHREMTPIDIVFLIQDLEFGGTQRYITNLLKHLDRNLFAPQLWVMRGGNEMEPMARKAGIEPHWLSKTKWVGPHSLAALAWNLRKKLPLILYTMMPVPNMWGRLLGNRLGVPVIVSSWRGLYPKQWESRLWHVTAKIICNADILRNIISTRHGVPPSRIAVIPNGVDCNLFAPAPEKISKHPIVTYMGRIVDDKDPMTLVKGFKLAAERIPDAEFLIVGNGYLTDKVNNFIQINRLEQRIKVFPAVSAAQTVLQKSWIFAMSSIREACPNAALEAMACGLPVVAPNIGGFPEIIEHGVNGSLYESRNPQELADALVDLLSDNSKRIIMSKMARERALNDYSLNKMVRHTEAVLLQTVEELGTGAVRF